MELVLSTTISSQNKQQLLEIQEFGNRIYVPGTTASIQGLSVPEGGWVVVSWTPVRSTSVDLAANHPVSSLIFPISAIAVHWFSGKNLYPAQTKYKKTVQHSLSRSPLLSLSDWASHRSVTPWEREDSECGSGVTPEVVYLPRKTNQILCPADPSNHVNDDGE